VLEKIRDDINCFDIRSIFDVNGNTLLHIAVQNNNKRAVKLCLSAGFDINIQNRNTGDTALHYCFSFNYIILAEYLISKGANTDIKNKKKLTPYEGTTLID